MRKETQETNLLCAKDDLSDKELIPKGRYSLDMPRIWRREICPKDKKWSVSLKMSRSCWLGRQTLKVKTQPMLLRRLLRIQLLSHATELITPNMSCTIFITQYCNHYMSLVMGSDSSPSLLYISHNLQCIWHITGHNE